MKIIVLVKQVPDSTEIRVDKVTGTLIRAGVPSIINPDDLAGVEAALQLKEKMGATVTIVSMGPPQAAEMLKELYARGVDECVLITDRKFGGADTCATSTTLAGALEKIGYDTARTDDLSVETATQITQAFCQRVAQAGYRPMIYGNVAWLMDRIDLAQLTQYDRWLAQYQTSPTFPYQFSMWQYGNQGTVAGIPGSVDMNLLLTPWD